MSDTDHQGTDILLPGARVVLFSEDSETRASVQVLAQDWRFGRVKMDIHDANVDAAISYFQNNPSGDLIIIQTSEINDQFTDKLAELSGYCDEGTTAIVIGPVNDVYLYRKLIKMGVSDYLVRPVKPEIIKELIAKTLISKLGVSESRLIAFIGAKGGVGVSALAKMCGWGVSEILHQKILLLDASGGWSSLSVGMGFDPSATLAQVVRAIEAKNDEMLQRMLFKASDHLTILASGADSMLAPTIAGEQLEHMIDYLMVKSPVVLVDLSGADAALKRVVLGRANKIVMVATPTILALRAARSLLKEVADLRGGQSAFVSLVINQVGLAKAHEVSAKDIEEALEFKIAASIPNNAHLFLGHESEMKKIIGDKEGGALLRNVLLPILKSVFSRNGEDEKKDGAGKSEKSGILGGFLNKLSAK